MPKSKRLEKPVTPIRDDVDFYVRGAILGKKVARVTRYGTFSPAENTRAIESIREAYLAKYPDMVAPMYRGRYCYPKGIAVKMYVACYFADFKIGAPTFYTKKPDGDNIAKMVGDALNKVLYHDDCQIADIQVRKFYWLIDSNPTYLPDDMYLTQSSFMHIFATCNPDYMTRPINYYSKSGDEEGPDEL